MFLCSTLCGHIKGANHSVHTIKACAVPLSGSFNTAAGTVSIAGNNCLPEAIKLHIIRFSHLAKTEVDY